LAESKFARAPGGENLTRLPRCRELRPRDVRQRDRHRPPSAWLRPQREAGRHMAL